MKLNSLLSFAAVIVALSLMVSCVSAISVPASQKYARVVTEIGGHSDISIVVQDVSSDANITASWEKAGWISFGADNLPSITLHPSLTGILPVRVTVPSDAQLGRNEIKILADGAEIASITVMTTLQQDAIKALQDDVNTLRQLADVNSNIEVIKSRIEGINQRINTTEVNIKSIAESQKDLKAIQNETNILSAKVDELRASSQSSGITGMFLGGAPLGLMAGFIAGIVVAFVFANRARLRKAM